MRNKNPVILYGASGFSGRLVAEFLREYNVPFVAAGRNRARIEEVMNRVPGIETAQYEIAEGDGSVDELTRLFAGAKVVCNTVGPFLYHGPGVIEAAWKAGCHYMDISGEQALPGGRSDANHPAAVADGVADFWTLLQDLEKRNQLPAEIFVLEIGVGMGTRAGLWLTRFRQLDHERGTKYYPRLRFLLGDYSPGRGTSARGGPRTFPGARARRSLLAASMGRAAPGPRRFQLLAKFSF